MFSVLNPEAPEFFPHLTEITQKGFQSIQKCIQASNILPSGASHDTFKTFTDFNILSSQLSSNIIEASNKILAAETNAVKLKSTDIEHNIEKLIEANDNILDRANMNIDIACGLRKPINRTVHEIRNPMDHVSPWNANPIISKIQMGSATLIGAKNIPRPQLKFKDTIDNSATLWVPRISDKPNNVKPLALNILYNDEGEAVGYEHPYQVELDMYHPPGEFLEADREPPSFPRSLDETPFTYVETDQQLDKLIEHLNEVKEFAVDVEHHSYRTYQGITCLIQLTTNEGGDFIIDALALRENLHKLNLAFTDPKKLKVFHGAEMDVIWLQRDFGVYIVGLFDTHQAAKALKLTGLSLKHLLMKYCQVDADKKYQLADWRIRPLPIELISYARVDTHYLLYMWRRMKSELMEGGTRDNRLLLSVFEQSRHFCGLTYNKTVLHEDSHIPLYLRSKKTFNSQQMAALKILYKWRDSQARELDESTAYLLPNHMLLSLADTLPREVQGVNACCSPMPPFVKQNLITLHRMILSCRELPLEPQLYQMPDGISAMVSHQRRSAAQAVHDLQHFPDFRDDLPVALTMEETVQYYGESHFSADVPVFEPHTQAPVYPTIVSELNVDAKTFIPPYERYKKYRSLAQIEEIKEFKEKEAKIAALGKGDELIKNEVLLKLKEPVHQRSESKPASVSVPMAVPPAASRPAAAPLAARPSHRKRKMPTDTKTQGIDNKTKETLINAAKSSKDTNKQKEHKNELNKGQVLKSYEYKNANYKKFYDDSGRFRQKSNQPKTKYKKHKK